MCRTIFSSILKNPIQLFTEIICLHTEVRNLFIKGIALRAYAD